MPPSKGLSNKKRTKVTDVASTKLTPLRSINKRGPIQKKEGQMQDIPPTVFSPALSSPKAKRTRIDVAALKSPILGSPTSSSSLASMKPMASPILSNTKDTLLEGVFGSPSSVLSATSKLTKEQKQASFEQWLKAATASVPHFPH